MRAALGLLLFLLSGVVFLGMFAFGEMADTTPPDGNASLHGLAFAWCGPLFWLGIWLMLGAERKLGQGAHLFLFVAVLACMMGLLPSLQRKDILWPAVQIGLGIGGLTLLFLFVGFRTTAKARLPQSSSHDTQA